MSSREFWLSCWSTNPVLLGVCALAAFAYAKLVRWRLSARSACAVSALGLFYLALGSPLDALVRGYLFSAHMVQHMLLLLLIPLLALLALPSASSSASRAATRGHGRQAARFRFALSPKWTWLGGVGAMWVWHEHALCDWATSSELGRGVQIVTLLILGTGFWLPLVGPNPAARMAPLNAVAYLFSACVTCSVLGILITFSSAGSVCPIYLYPKDPLHILNLIRNDWGISRQFDQQLGGLIMWVPGCGIYLWGVVLVLARWYLSPDEARPSDPVASAWPDLAPSTSATSAPKVLAPASQRRSP